MKKLGLYDLTPALCHLDYPMTETGGTTKFVRDYTLASGGPCCDCGYRKVCACSCEYRHLQHRKNDCHHRQNRHRNTAARHHGFRNPSPIVCSFVSKNSFRIYMI